MAGCPRCPGPATTLEDGSTTCPVHGPVATLWRPEEAAYDAFAEHLRAAGGFPTLLPWPLGPGWSVSDFGVVLGARDQPVATMTCATGSTEEDGPVDVLVVSEEPGTGLGARCAGLDHPEPGDAVAEGPPVARLRVDNLTASLWQVSTSSAVPEFDRSVLAGEADGRWIWVVFRPSAALLLVSDDWPLRDVSGLGASLLDLPFGGPTPQW